MKKTLTILAVLAAVSWALWPNGSAVDSTGESTPDALDCVTVANRVWISQLPQTPKEKFDLFIMLDEPSVGVFERLSAFEGDFSLFAWKGNEERRVDILMLQTDKKHTLDFAISDSGCGSFDYCLRLRGAPRGAKTYGSMRDWIIESRGAPGVVEIGQRFASALGAPISFPAR